MNKHILFGIMGLSVLGLQGCGGSSSSSAPSGGTTTPTTTVQLSGAVVDWYIQDALVFADFDANGIYDAATEPSVRTNVNGIFDSDALRSLIPETVSSYNLVAKGGTDKATNNYYAATLLAEGHYRNITPLTTLDTLLIQNHNYSSADADLIVQKLIGMEDSEDVVKLDANPATNKYLLSGARMLAMYNNVLVKIMSQVVKPTDTTYSQDDINIKLSRDAWDQMAAQVDYEYQQELIKEGGNKNKVEPEIGSESLWFMVKLLVKRYQTQLGLADDAAVIATANDLMDNNLRSLVVSEVERLTDDDFISSTHVFGENEDDDDEYMSVRQTNQDDVVTTLIDNYFASGKTLPAAYIRGDDDEEEYGDDEHHHD